MSFTGRGAVLSVHGTGAFALKTVLFDASSFEAANELPALALGTVCDMEGGSIKLYKYRYIIRIYIHIHTYTYINTYSYTYINIHTLYIHTNAYIHLNIY
jgi:hypothetical protein